MFQAFERCNRCGADFSPGTLTPHEGGPVCPDPVACAKREGELAEWCDRKAEESAAINRYEAGIKD